MKSNTIVAVLLLSVISISFSAKSSEQSIVNRINSKLDSSKFRREQGDISKAIKFTLQAEEIWEQSLKKDLNVKSEIELSYAYTFEYVDTTIALKHYRNGVILKRKLFSDCRSYYNNVYRMALAYSSVNLDSTIFYLEQLKECTKLDGYEIEGVGLNNDIGIFESRRGNWEMAFVYFKTASAGYEKIEDDGLSTLPISIRDNISDYYLIKKDTATAIELINQNLDALEFIDNQELFAYYSRYTYYGLKLANLYLLNQKYNLSEKVLKRTYPVYSGNIKWKLTYQIQYKKLQIILAEKLNNLQKVNLKNKELNKLSLELLELTQKQNVAINKAFNQYRLSSIKNQIELIKRKKDEEKSELFIRAVTLIVILSLVLIIVFILVINYRNKARIKSTELRLRE